MAEQEDDVRPRAFWSGTITFGLVSIPVELYPANRSQRVSLRMTAPDGTPLSRRYFCPKEDRALEWDEIVRGYEIEKDSFVVVTEDELERLAPERTRDIDLRRFVPASDIDPIHFERAYYLTPGGNSTKAYRLLAATMEQTGRAGVATFVMRGKEYLVAILAENGILRAETLRFADEIRTPEDVGLPAAQKAKAADVKRIEKAIASRTRKELDEGELADTGAEQLLKLVARKQKSGEDVIPAGAAGAEPSEDVIDLMEVLRRSLQGRAQEEDDGTEARKSAAKRAGGKKSTGSKKATSAGAKKSTAKKSTAKKSTAKKSTAKKSTAKKSTAKQSTPKKSARKGARKSPRGSTRRPAKKSA